MEYTDVIRMAAYFAVIFLNREVAKILVVELLLELLFIIPIDGFTTCLVMSSVYSLLAVSPIRINNTARMLIMQVGVINWLAAADYAFYPYETIFYQAYPYLINVIDTLIIWHLIPQGGRERVGHTIRGFFIKCARFVYCRATGL